MPRKHRVPLRRRRPEALDRVTRRLLGKGQDFHGHFRDRDRRREIDIDRARQLWETLREDFMAEWIEAHPGYRPWAWWTFDAPPDRRDRIDGKAHPHDRPDYHAPKNLVRGIPRNWCRPDDADARFETELDYLARHDLLFEGEAERAAELGAAANPYRLKIDTSRRTPAVSGEEEAECQ